jgi:hypothetical protein
MRRRPPKVPMLEDGRAEGEKLLVVSRTVSKGVAMIGLSKPARPRRTIKYAWADGRKPKRKVAERPGLPRRARSRGR